MALNLKPIPTLQLLNEKYNCRNRAKFYDIVDIKMDAMLSADWVNKEYFISNQTYLCDKNTSCWWSPDKLEFLYINLLFCSCCCYWSFLLLLTLSECLCQCNFTLLCYIYVTFYVILYIFDAIFLSTEWIKTIFFWFQHFYISIM